jgi:hypothetical protein
VPAVLIGPIVVPVLTTGSVLPFHPSALSPPLAAQLVALAEVQASEVDCPAWMEFGVAVKALILAAGGAAMADTVAVAGALAPPGPVQIKVNTYVPTALSAPLEVPVLCSD